MGRKKQPEDDAQLPLFDLPLQPAGVEAATERPRIDSPTDDPEPEVKAGRVMELDPVPTPALAPESRPQRQAAGQAQTQEALPLFPETETAIDLTSGADTLASESVDIEDPPEPARFQDRLLAGLADLSIIALVLATATAGVLLMEVPLTSSDLWAFGVLGLVFSFLYTIIPLAFWGQTPGMAWLGLMAYGPDPENEPLTFSQTLWRWLGGLLTLSFFGLPLLLILSGESLSDRLSGSQTVAL